MPRNPFDPIHVPNFPDALTSKPKFLSYLGVGQPEINLISARKFYQYRLVSIPKRRGGFRTVSIPNDRLKFIQRRINELLVIIYKPRKSVHGFVLGKSAFTNAQVHLGRPHLVKVDFKDYFGQITSARVQGMLRSLGIPLDVSEIITSLVTLFGILPQGAPTSPIIANMVTFRFDNWMLEYARSNRLLYTRYADDIVLSSYSRPRIIQPNIQENYKRLTLSDLSDDFRYMFDEEGFELNESKLIYCGFGSRRSVTGYTINKFMNVPRQHIRRIRAILRNIATNGYDSEQLKFSLKTKSIKSLKRSLQGQIEWVGSTKGLSDPVFRRYAILFNTLLNGSIRVGPDVSNLAEKSTWVVEVFDLSDASKGDQGTVFFLKGVGLVTAAHCVPPNHRYEVFCIKEPGKRYEVSVLKRHDVIDLAILSHSIPVEKFIELTQAEREANSGEQIHIWGFPNYGPGHGISKKTGRITSQPRVSAVPLYAVDQKIYGGNSGGPVLNSREEVIGVCHKGGVAEAHDLAVKIKMISQI